MTTLANFAAAKLIATWSGIEVITACIINLTTGLLSIGLASKENTAAIDGLALKRLYVLLGSDGFNVELQPGSCIYKLSPDQLIAIRAMEAAGALHTFPIRGSFATAWEGGMTVSVPCAVGPDRVIDGASRILACDDVLTLIASQGDVTDTSVQHGASRFDASQGNDGVHRIDEHDFNAFVLAALNQPVPLEGRLAQAS